jgi:hypothetical protein
MRSIYRILIVSLAVLSLAGTAWADAAGKKPKYFVDESELPFAALPGATAHWGVVGGAGFRAEVPDAWNGRLVVWAHGFRGSGLELTVDNHPLRQLLIPLGFAWASSSYSRNDYDVSSGVQSTRAMVSHLEELVGEPELVYLTGASMGGHVTAVSIEQFANVYDAALPICGVLGDYELFDYFLDFNSAAQQIGTGASVFPVDPVIYTLLTVPTIKANLEAVPGGWPIILNAAGEDLKSLTALRSGGFRPNFDEAWFFWNTFPDFATGPGNFLFDLAFGDGTLPRTPGVGVDNAETVYQFDANPALTPDEQALNDEIVRVEADPNGRTEEGLSQVPIIDGDISIPVLSLHNLGDLFVPFHNEIEYANRVESHGKSDLLVQRAIRGVGHCDFSPEEFSTAFLDLVAWRESGVKPGGDDVQDPSNVASPDFGCAYTNDPGNTHLLATPCP